MISAIIVDVDGTLARRHEDRGYFDWHLVGNDYPHEDIIELVNMYANKGYAVIVVSGRDEVCRLETEDWLDKFGVAWDQLYMRPANNNYKDAVIKQQIYDRIKEHFDIRLVIDDRNQVVEMWRSLGLRVLQVASGNF